MKLQKIVLMFILMLFAVPLMAQVNVQLAWDPGSADEPINPYSYKLYQCTDATYQNCQVNDAGQNTQYGPVALAHASTTFFYTTAWRYDWIVADEQGNIIQHGNLVESDKSNVIQVKAFAPPGNPKNQRIQVTQVGENESGLDLYAELMK